MEFVQFHPTGMVWPPSVRGILVTEGVRGEGGILTNSQGRRFMFDDIPEAYRAQTASDEDEGWRYTQGDKAARRPPELLTRDHVSRCIVRELKEGRGSPHGGVFLDISWIKQRIPNAEEHIKKKLPSMYHQFKQLADIDITKEPMEVGPTTHYVMGGVRVDAETQMSSVPGLFAAGECAAGINGANRLGGNSLSDLLVFGKRAGEFAAKYARSAGARHDSGATGGSGCEELPRTVRTRRAGRRTVSGPVCSAGNDAGPCRHRQKRSGDAARARGARDIARAGSPSERRRSSRIQPRMARGARSPEPAARIRGGYPFGDRAAREPRRSLPRGLSRQGSGVRKGQHRGPQRARRPHGAVSRRRFRKCRTS